MHFLLVSHSDVPAGVENWLKLFTAGNAFIQSFPVSYSPPAFHNYYRKVLFVKRYFCKLSVCNDSAVSLVLCKPQNKESFSQFCFDMIMWTIIAK